MTHEGMGPSMAVVGSTKKAVFEAYVEEVLRPSLRAGQVVSSWITSAPTRARG